MKIALYQGPSPAGFVETAFKTIANAVKASAELGVEMTVFPELYLPGYNIGDTHHDLAQPLNGEWQERLSAIASEAGCGITLGFCERDGDRLYNSALCLGADGKLLSHYRKIQLYGEQENALFVAGERYSIFSLAGIKTALLICYDVEFAQHCQALRRQGVELLLVPTATMQPYTYVTDTILPARALETGLTIVFCNYCGSEGDLTYIGNSAVYGPHGKPLAKADTDETLLIADLQVTHQIPDDMRTTYLEDFKPID